MDSKRGPNAFVNDLTGEPRWFQASLVGAMLLIAPVGFALGFFVAASVLAVA